MIDRHKIYSIVLLGATMLGATSCAAIQGERVETGMASSSQVDLEPQLSAVESTVDGGGESTADSDAGLDRNTAGRAAEVQPAAILDSLHSRSPSEISPEWTTQPAAFDFTVPELFSGAPVSGRDLYQSGPVIMTYVSPSCVVSAEDAEAFALVAELHQSVTFVFVHTDGDSESFEQFVDNADLYYQNVLHINDSDLALWNRFGIETQPSTMLVDRSGRATLAQGGLGQEGLMLAVGLLGVDR